MPITISKNEACVLGYNAAGWGALEAQEKRRKVMIYGFGNTPVKDEDSYYHQHHDTKVMSEAKESFIKEVAANELLANLENTLNKSQKNLLIQIFKFLYTKLIDECSLIELSDETDTLTNALSMQGISSHQFLWLIGDSFRVKESLYDFNCDPDEIDTMEKNLMELIEIADREYAHSKERFNEIQTNDYSGLQKTMWGSKRIIADVFQENLRRYEAGEPLIPIKITIASEQTEFVPNLVAIKEKSDAFITPTEIRMIYKLIHEIQDEDSRNIMAETVTFLKQDKSGEFIVAEAPWSTVSWLDRPRGQRREQKESYSTREMPNWMREIVENRGKGPETLRMMANSSLSSLSVRK